MVTMVSLVSKSPFDCPKQANENVVRDKTVSACLKSLEIKCDIVLGNL